MKARRPTSDPGLTHRATVRSAVKRTARRRLRWLVLAYTGFMLAIGLRGVQLTYTPDDKVLELITAKRWFSFHHEGQRGDILARDGRALALSVKSPTIGVDPVAVDESRRANWNPVDFDQMVTDLAGILKMDEGEVRRLVSLTGDGGAEARYRKLAEDVHPSVAEQIRELGYHTQGIVIKEPYRRFYPEGRLASQLLGFVDRKGTGVGGVESAFDGRLQAPERTTRHRVNRRGQVLDASIRRESELHGQSIRTTIDRHLQSVAEKALGEVMEKHEPLSAVAVVVDVRTGDVLAMANMPDFNPNVASLERVQNGRNISVTDAVEPGSVFKPFTMAAALEEKLVTSSTVLDTTSPYEVHPGTRIRDDHPHPSMTVAEMVKFSSNVGAAKLAARLGKERVYDYFTRFGFGDRPGLGLPGEARGVLRPPSRIGPVELSNISFGQGVTASALQLAMATAALGNKGVLMKPRLVSAILDDDGEVLREVRPSIMRRVVSPETAADVLVAMEMVTDDDGTAKKARVPGYRVGGKTGTAQKVTNGVYGSARLASFIGIAPIDDPRIAVAVIVDEPSVGSRYGGIVAAPVFQKVAASYFTSHRIPPSVVSEDLEEGDQADPEPVEIVDLTDKHRLVWDGDGWVLPDMGGMAMRDALATLQGAGLRLDIEGSGHLVRQEPLPGERREPGQAVALWFE